MSGCSRIILLLINTVSVISKGRPAVRLNSLGIRQANKEIIEAGQSFGCTPPQLLFNV